jgi:hypothetical protein
MGNRLLTLILLVAVLFSAVAFVPRIGSFHLPGNQRDYAPAQPIAFSHRLHTGELQVDCLYCHFGAEASRHAGVPAESVCMNCHKFVTAPLGAVQAEDELAQKESRKPRPVVSPELAKLYHALALDPKMQPIPGQTPAPLAWIKVHNLPDFAYFDHRAHVTAGVACQRCHGPVETMERVYQVEDLSMGWCVNCHRQVNQTGVAGKTVAASIDCVACHH